MKIAVSGATSFIGKKIIERASMLGWSTVAIVRENSRNTLNVELLPNTQIVDCDLLDYKYLGEKTGSVDCFIHLAWDGTRGNARNDEKRQRDNYNWGIAAIESMVNQGCKRIVTAGSQAEYGLVNGIIDEKTPCHPNTEYGKYKLKLFEDASLFCQKNNVSFKEPRYFSLYGPRDNPNTMIMSILSCMIANEPCKLTKCIQMWDFLYIDDAIDGLLGLCERTCEDGAYNFGSGDCRPLKEFVQEMKLISCSKSELIYGAVPYSSAGIVSIQPDISKLCREINWKPKTSFELGIRRILSSLSERY